jgi:hypothetical protein
MRMGFAAVVGSTVVGFWVAASLALTQQKTVEACQAEWRANKAVFQPKGITEKEYVDECRDFTAAPTAPAAPKSASRQATHAVAPGPAPAGKPARTTTPTPGEGNQFPTEAQAKARCRLDTVVWANLSTKMYHFSGYKDYGNTKNGTHMCEKDATRQGFRAVKTEKHPA